MILINSPPQSKKSTLGKNSVLGWSGARVSTQEMEKNSLNAIIFTRTLFDNVSVQD